jgi:hypothetical protein
MDKAETGDGLKRTCALNNLLFENNKYSPLHICLAFAFPMENNTTSSRGSRVTKNDFSGTPLPRVMCLFIETRWYKFYCQTLIQGRRMIAMVCKVRNLQSVVYYF